VFQANLGYKTTTASTKKEARTLGNISKTVQGRKFIVLNAYEA
jgi:hypothetical protein